MRRRVNVKCWPTHRKPECYSDRWAENTSDLSSRKKWFYDENGQTCEKVTLKMWTWCESGARMAKIGTKSDFKTWKKSKKLSDFLYRKINQPESSFGNQLFSPFWKCRAHRMTSQLCRQTADLPCCSAKCHSSAELTRASTYSLNIGGSLTLWQPKRREQSLTRIISDFYCFI